jgi:hypothetical protein
MVGVSFALNRFSQSCLQNAAYIEGDADAFTCPSHIMGAPKSKDKTRRNLYYENRLRVMNLLI